ncbi:MAG: cytochrome c family protein [Myxococcota bacterium]
MIWALIILAGCKEPEPTLTAEELRNPETCAGCHPTQYEQWSGSMHAYASIDPVFRAMNNRGQRETDGELGDFCVQCHAPVALDLGETEDGTNIAEVDDHLQGVGCVYCHTTVEVTGTHNAALRQSDEKVLYAGITDPIENTAHDMGYSRLMDRNAPESSDTCGACHDIVLDSGLHIEQTHLEWQESLFNQSGSGRLSCNHCHMRAEDGVVAAGGPQRLIHDHSMPGVDVALIDFPQKDAQLEGVQRELDLTLLSILCVTPIAGGSEIILQLENAGAGHKWPSGATFDRRAWAEITAYNGDDVIFANETVPRGTALKDVVDPNRWEMHDIATIRGSDAHPMIWEVEELERRALPAPTTTDPTDPAFFHSVERRWPLAGQVPDRVVARVFIRPFGLEILEDLVESGDLDASIIANVPTFELQGAAIEWAGELGSCTD